MTTPNDPQQQPDALNALENFASGNGSPPPKDGSVDASGFVGMMARGQVNEADPAGSKAPPPATRRPMANVSPKATAAPTPKSTNPTSGAIPVAKEIIPEQTSPPEPEAAAEESAEYFEETAAEEPAPEPPATPAAQAPQARAPRARSRRRVPGWFQTAVPISFTLGALLMAIGLWALLAVLSWASAKDMVPGYTHEDSVLMPFVLLLSLPVGIALEVMAIIMMKQLKRQAQLDEADGI